MLRYEIKIDFSDDTVRRYKTSEDFIMSPEILEGKSYNDAVTRWACRLFNLSPENIVTAKAFEVSNESNQ